MILTAFKQEHRQCACWQDAPETRILHSEKDQVIVARKRLARKYVYAA